MGHHMSDPDLPDVYKRQVTGIIYALIFDQILKRRLASKATKEDR